MINLIALLFILIGLFGSSERVRAGFYLFLYTLSGSLFLLLAILFLFSCIGLYDFEGLFKSIINFSMQNFLFIGIFIAFAVKTPVIFFNN
jgi:NADH-ubiquinone oxidoreductase chain 4